MFRFADVERAVCRAYPLLAKLTRLSSRNTEVDEQGYRKAKPEEAGQQPPRD